MHRFSFQTVFLIVALVAVVYGASSAQAVAEAGAAADQLAEEFRDRALTLTDGPKYVKKQSTARNNTKETLPKSEAHTHKPDLRPPSKPPINPNKTIPQKFYVDIARPHFNPLQQIPLRQHMTPTQLHLYHSANSLYKFPQVIPLPPHKNPFYMKQQSRPLLFASSTIKASVAKSPKFSIPVQTINGVRKDFVRPPPQFTNTTKSTTTVGTTTTTSRPLRTKRIWPKKILEKYNGTLHNTSASNDTKLIDDSINETDHDTSETAHRVRIVFKNTTASETPSKRPYRPVTRVPKIRSTTPVFTLPEIEPNDWVPLVPSHYSKKSGRPALTRISKRSDIYPAIPEPSISKKRLLYLHSFGLVPVKNLQTPNPNINAPPEIARKKMAFFRKRKRQLNPYYSGYSPKPGIGTPHHFHYDDQVTDGTTHHKHPRVVTKIKHHHHHHHHRYIKTVEKPVRVPYKVEVPKPYPVPVEKKVPVPVEKIRVVEKPVPYKVTVEKKVPYPVGFKVPHPVPVKVIEKEYVPKPYPVVHHVPVLKHVEVKVPHPVPVTVEKRVPYPVEVRVPVDRPVPVPVTVEKQVPYPVPVKVLVPQPYPVETKVPYPVQVKVKEPVEVIKHVPVKVPVPQPFAVKVPHPVPVAVEKRVPYPVEVEKKVPVPFQVLVPQKVEVEKKVPVYVPKPYPVEKKVPVPIKVPYPVKVPVRVPVQVPVEVPVYIHNPFIYGEDYYSSGGGVTSAEITTADPHHTVTVHGNTGFNGFQSRSDTTETTTTSTPSP